MLNGRNLVLDTMSEVYSLLRPWRDDEFWDFSAHVPVPGSIYVLGRQQVLNNRQKFLDMAEDPGYVMVFGNSAEGSVTLRDQVSQLGILDHIRAGKILLISGGDQDSSMHYLQHEHFLIRVLDYEENQREVSRMPEIYSKTEKPYKFLFLNGRARPHRKYLYERLRQAGLLDSALWTFLDGRGTSNRQISLVEDGQELMRTNTPIQYLPKYYEVDKFQDTHPATPEYAHQYIKFELFRNLWGEIYLRAEPYVDTYFSLVTETVFEEPLTFRTEKIAKPLAMGHPWICASGPGFYRDLRNLGFRTFDPIIDESFDSIVDHRSRMERIVSVVQDLCRQDLAAFLREAESVCKYNQQHLREIVPRLKNEFPERFFQFIQHERP